MASMEQAQCAPLRRDCGRDATPPCAVTPPKSHRDLAPHCREASRHLFQTATLIRALDEIAFQCLVQQKFLHSANLQRLQDVRRDDRSKSYIPTMPIRLVQPTPKHARVEDFVTPKAFDAFGAIARAKGFLQVASSPLTRSSYHAGDDFARMRASREAKLAKQQTA